MRPVDVVAQIKMERQKHKGAFLIFEGGSDIRRFKKFFIERNCEFVNAYGRENVEGAIEIEENNGSLDVLGFVDADFDEIIGNSAADDNIIVSKYHDFDLVVCSTSAISRFLDAVAMPGRVEECGGVRQCVEHIMRALLPLSAARFASVRYGMGYSFSSIEHAEFFDGMAIDVDTMVDALCWGRLSTPEHKAELKERVAQFAQSQIDIWQVTNGHDLMAAIGVALRNRLANHAISQTSRGVIESRLSHTFNAADFDDAGLRERIAAWEQAEGGRPSLLL